MDSVLGIHPPKTVEGTKLQLVSEAGRTSSIIVSTLVEAWYVVDGGLVSGGIVKDVSCPYLCISPV